MDDHDETKQGDEHGGHDGWESADPPSTAPPQVVTWPDSETSPSYPSFYFDTTVVYDLHNDFDDDLDNDFEELADLAFNQGAGGRMMLSIEIALSADDGNHQEMDASMEDNYREGYFGAAPAAREAIQALVVEKYKAEKGARRVAGDSSTSTMCVVCQEQLVEGVDVVCMPCSHEFHADCLFPWLNRSRFCPICRFELPRENGWTSG